MKGQIIGYFASRGCLLTPAAKKYLEEMDQQRLNEFVENFAIRKSIIDVDDLQKALPPEREFNRPTSIIRKSENRNKDLRKTGKLPDMPRVLSDVSGKSNCSGEIDDFVAYINNRYERLSNILKKMRPGSVSIKMAKRKTTEVSIIGMVRETKTTSKGHLIVEIEDRSGVIPVLIKRDSDLIGETFLADEVISFTGRTSSRGGDMFYADSITRPKGIKARRITETDSRNEVAIISDIHVGSDTFLLDEWKRFVEWLGTGEAERVKYLLVAGDLVDGIGIYPGQEKELEITDIYEQYERLAELVRDIPSDIRIIMHPGNHDAVRPAEPQPVLPENIRKLFPENVMFTGNPVYLEIEGRTFLSYHGRSMDDILSSVPGLSYETPILAMKEMLKRRLLVPTYGQKTPLAPEEWDYMLIDPLPDVLVTGHVHSYGVDEYNGVTIVNASTWQSQTEYQKMHNFHPQPARVAIYNLGTGKVRTENFMGA